MRKILNISLLICLLGLSGLSHYGVDPSGSESNEPVFSYSDSTIPGNAEVTVSPKDYPALIKTENLNEVKSEIDPRTSITADWRKGKNKYFTQNHYLIRSSLFEVSQSIRTLIFPFHTHL